MNYTKENIVGLEIVLRDGTTSYKVISVSGDGWLTTESIHNFNHVESAWCNITDANDWLKTGIWKQISACKTYEIY